MKIVKELEMTIEKKNLIYSMLLNIRDNINEKRKHQILRRNRMKEKELRKEYESSPLK